MRIYLDNSVLNRPFDDQSQPRVWIETLSFILVLSLVENGHAQFLRSWIHDVENDRCPSETRREFVRLCLELAEEKAAFPEPKIRERANELNSFGVKAYDALHLASAEILQADVFLTCDDRLPRRYSGKLKIVNPAAFLQSLT